MSWLTRVITSRYLKSAVRYLIAGLIGLLSGLTFDIPVAQDLLMLIQSGVVNFLELNQEQIVEVIVSILTGLLATWSATKNRANAKIEEVIHRRVK